jgi:ATP-dependent helicase HrpB
MRGIDYCVFAKEELDIADATQVAAAISERNPWALVNAAGGERAVQEIAKLAPNSITLTRGRTVELEYSQKKAPVAASRLQDFFGTTVHPTVGGGKIAIICELLSPAKRPVQVTDDLPRFWKGSYAEVRKELKSRYPKHDWPEDPAAATPTSRARPRGS